MAHKSVKLAIMLVALLVLDHQILSAPLAQRGLDITAAGIVKAAQILLDVMLAAIRDDHKVQYLRSDQYGEHHRSDLRCLADNRSQHVTLIQHQTGHQKAEQRIEIHAIGKQEGNPCFWQDLFGADAKIEINAH